MGSIVALIPARGGSKRLTRKNVRLVDGKPLLHYPIKTSIESGLFDHIVVSTEDDEIASIAKRNGADVIQRPMKLADDESTVVDVCLHALNLLQDSEIFCCIYATAFLFRTESLVNSLKLLDEPPEADFVMGVSEYEFSPVQALKTDCSGFLSLMWPEWHQIKSQFHPKLCVSNGSFYWARTSSFRTEKTFYGERLKGYIMKMDEVSDIDTQTDLETAVKIYLSKK